MRSRKIPAPHSTVFRKRLQNPYEILIWQYALLNLPLLNCSRKSPRRSQHYSRRPTECSVPASLGKCCHFRATPRMNSDRTLTDTISFTSGKVRGVPISPRCSDRQAVASFAHAGDEAGSAIELMAPWSGLLAVSTACVSPRITAPTRGLRPSQNSSS